MRESLIGVAVIIGLMGAGFVGGIWIAESLDEAHEQGYEEGQIVVYKLWNVQLKKIIDIFKTRGLLPSDSTVWDDSKIYRWPYADPTDTMPAVDPDTTAHAKILWADTMPAMDSVVYVDTFYTNEGLLVSLTYSNDGWHCESLDDAWYAPVVDSVPHDTTPAVDSVGESFSDKWKRCGPPYPWFWSDSAVMNDEYWVCPNDEGWGFLPSCVLRDSLPDVCILRFPDMIIFWDTKLMDSTNPLRSK
jgi:hypothetical protein